MVVGQMDGRYAWERYVRAMRGRGNAGGTREACLLLAPVRVLIAAEARGGDGLEPHQLNLVYLRVLLHTVQDCLQIGR